MTDLKLIECPRDAMQGLKSFIPTELKARYINQLLECGFDTIDFGSFVSPKAIPQLKDTAEVLAQLKLDQTQSKLLAIVANQRGADDALVFDEIDFLGYPFSVSETFQQRNTNSSIEESLKRVEGMQESCLKAGKKLVVYLSMGFGNPYGDDWSPEIVARWSERLHKEMEINILALSDTIGAANPELVSDLFKNLIPELPQVEFGAHLHTLPENAQALTRAAYEAGCRRFDGAIKGFGGCPMAANSLTGNMPTEEMLRYFEGASVNHGVDMENFSEAMQLATNVFPMEEMHGDE
ncbi:MAG: hydroxymethylglutaryl-CoA lyase [Bacteroidetes bacterium]|nr:MAG: hydroxymethylglutaryl-CoA lyase [Bacteroidota bacterium]